MEQLSTDFEKKVMEIGANTIATCQDHPAVMVKALQIVEREEKLDALLKQKLEAQKLDPYDEVHAKSFRRYKEKFLINLRDAISTHFDSALGNITAVDQIVKESQLILDELTVVLDDVVPCFPTK